MRVLSLGLKSFFFQLITILALRWPIQRRHKKHGFRFFSPLSTSPFSAPFLIFLPSSNFRFHFPPFRFYCSSFLSFFLFSFLPNFLQLLLLSLHCLPLPQSSALLLLFSFYFFSCSSVFFPIPHSFCFFLFLFTVIAFLFVFLIFLLLFLSFILLYILHFLLLLC